MGSRREQRKNLCIGEFIISKTPNRLLKQHKKQSNYFANFIIASINYMICYSPNSIFYPHTESTEHKSTKAHKLFRVGLDFQLLLPVLLPAREVTCSYFLLLTIDLTINVNILIGLAVKPRYLQLEK